MRLRPGADKGIYLLMLSAIKALRQRRKRRYTDASGYQYIGIGRQAQVETVTERADEIQLNAGAFFGKHRRAFPRHFIEQVYPARPYPVHAERPPEKRIDAA